MTDFGFSGNLRAGKKALDKHGPKGTALYMAPEVLMQQEFDQSIDLYAWALIVWELLTMVGLVSAPFRLLVSHFAYLFPR